MHISATSRLRNEQKKKEEMKRKPGNHIAFLTTTKTFRACVKSAFIHILSIRLFVSSFLCFTPFRPSMFTRTPKAQRNTRRGYAIAANGAQQVAQTRKCVVKPPLSGANVPECSTVRRSRALTLIVFVVSCFGTSAHAKGQGSLTRICYKNGKWMHRKIKGGPFCASLFGSSSNAFSQ